MDNNKNKIQTLIAIIVLLVIVVAGTYAFFAPQAGGTTSTNTTVTSNTTDLLTFSINRDISFTVTQNDFQENGTNQSGDATATATLTPNNKTGAATMNYYLYLNIESNPIEYSSTNTNGLPELMLQVFDSNNQLVTLSDLGNQVTVKGVTGYDITAIEGPITLLDNHAISASNNTATIENWRIVVTLINHDFNQNDNTGKEVSAEIIIQKEELNLGFTGTIYRNGSELVYIGSPFIQSLYCIYNGSTGENSCNYGINFNSLEDCEDELVSNNLVGSICQHEERGAFSYETDVNIIRAENYYLKHNIENNIIESTEVCLYYNNSEFCLANNYWVETGNGNQYHESEENKIASWNKLKSEMETTIGIPVDKCNVYDGEIFCLYNDFSCCTESSGSVNIQGGYGELCCKINVDGSSYCDFGMS